MNVRFINPSIVPIRERSSESLKMAMFGLSRVGKNRVLLFLACRLVCLAFVLPQNIKVLPSRAWPANVVTSKCRHKDQCLVIVMDVRRMSLAPLSLGLISSSSVFGQWCMSMEIGGPSKSAESPEVAVTAINDLETGGAVNGARICNNTKYG